MSIWPFRRSRASEDAEKLLNAVIGASRQARFFGPGRVPDTLEGRFELVTLHASLALVRLRSDSGLAPLAQEFTDQLFKSFDAGLREEGVGDSAVPKRMHKLAGSFYGRLNGYAEALKTGQVDALSAAVTRNVLGAEGAFAADLAAELFALWQRQAAAPAEALLEPVGWRRAQA